MQNSIFASIDIGSNTIRLLIAQVQFDRNRNQYSLNEIHSERVITRLGSAISEKGCLEEDAINRSIAALIRFRNIIKDYRVLSTAAVATSALREANNRDLFLEKAKTQAGFDIEVISGEKEAMFTASGILSDVDITGPVIMADIGGGSTELILCTNSTPELAHSLNLGVVYLASKYMFHDPPSDRILKKMEEEILSHILKFRELFAGVLRGASGLIGTAGTVTALAAIAQGLATFEHQKIHMYTLFLERVQSIYDRVSTLSSHERAKLIPFDLARLDIIVPGTLILLKLMESFGFKEITVSNYGLREGIVIDLYNKAASLRA